MNALLPTGPAKPSNRGQPSEPGVYAHCCVACDMYMLTADSCAHVVAVSAEATGAVDPVIQHLLKNARSEAVRQEFLRMPADDYTAKHDVHVLVSPVVTAAECQSARCKTATQLSALLLALCVPSQHFSSHMHTSWLVGVYLSLCSP